MLGNGGVRNVRIKNQLKTDKKKDTDTVAWDEKCSTHRVQKSVSYCWGWRGQNKGSNLENTTPGTRRLRVRLSENLTTGISNSTNDV